MSPPHNKEEPLIKRLARSRALNGPHSRDSSLSPSRVGNNPSNQQSPKRVVNNLPIQQSPRRAVNNPPISSTNPRQLGIPYLFPLKRPIHFIIRICHMKSFIIFKHFNKCSFLHNFFLFFFWTFILLIF